mmetsp:Transcript_10775/g.15777  ORF Transcript_10775/g.15777 Transcript_10775/m.15777 type:complete len:1105 (+) Transcript_10775:229-3543(+)
MTQSYDPKNKKNVEDVINEDNRFSLTGYKKKKKFSIVTPKSTPKPNTEYRISPSFSQFSPSNANDTQNKNYHFKEEENGKGAAEITDITPVTPKDETSTNTITIPIYNMNHPLSPQPVGDEGLVINQTYDDYRSRQQANKFGRRSPLISSTKNTKKLKHLSNKSIIFNSPNYLTNQNVKNKSPRNGTHRKYPKSSADELFHQPRKYQLIGNTGSSSARGKSTIRPESATGFTPEKKHIMKNIKLTHAGSKDDLYILTKSKTQQDKKITEPTTTTREESPIKTFKKPSLPEIEAPPPTKIEDDDTPTPNGGSPLIFDRKGSTGSLTSLSRRDISKNYHSSSKISIHLAADDDCDSTKGLLDEETKSSSQEQFVEITSKSSKSSLTSSKSSSKSSSSTPASPPSPKSKKSTSSTTSEPPKKKKIKVQPLIVPTNSVPVKNSVTRRMMILFNTYIWIEPFGFFREIYNQLLLIGVIYHCWTAPYRVGFETYTNVWFYVLDFIVDCIFFFGIIIECLSYATNEFGALVPSRKMRLKQYCLHYLYTIPEHRFIPPILYNRKIYIISFIFLIDLLGIFPLPWILAWLPYIRLMRIVTLLRWNYYKKCVIVKHMNTAVFKIVQSILAILLVVHCSSCAWFFIARQYSEFNNFILRSQFAEPLYYNVFLPPPGDYSYSMWRVKQYISSLFFANIAKKKNNAFPQDINQTIYAVLFVLLGAFFYVTMIQSLKVLIKDINRWSTFFDVKMNTIRQFMKHKHLSPQIKKRIVSYQTIMMKSGRMLDQQNYMSDLDLSLGLKVKQFLYAEFLEVLSTDFLKLGHLFMEDVLGQLDYLLILPQSTIVSRGEPGKEMFFIGKGIAELVSVDEKTGKERVLGQLYPGNYFGELAMLYDIKRTIDVRAVTTCEIYSLPIDRFIQLSKNHLNFYKLVCEDAHERIKMLLLEKSHYPPNPDLENLVITRSDVPAFHPKSPESPRHRERSPSSGRNRSSSISSVGSNNSERNLQLKRRPSFKRQTSFQRPPPFSKQASFNSRGRSGTISIGSRPPPLVRGRSGSIALVSPSGRKRSGSFLYRGRGNTSARQLPQLSIPMPVFDIYLPEAVNPTFSYMKDLLES